MRKFVIMACAAVAATGLGVAAASADDAGVSTCTSLEQQVDTALNVQSQSPTRNDAERERRYGAEFCGSGFYARGADHFRRALQMLSANGN